MIVWALHYDGQLCHHEEGAIRVCQTARFSTREQREKAEAEVGVSMPLFGDVQ